MERSKKKYRVRMAITAMIGFILSITISAVLTGCGGNEKYEEGEEEKRLSKPANEMIFSLDNIEELTISYDEEAVIFLENEEDKLIIREYMTKDTSRYYAKVKQGKKSIKINEGKKPLLKTGFWRYVEVLLPANYNKSLTVTTTDGMIDLSKQKRILSRARMDTASGKVLIDEMTASDLYLSSTSGTLELGRLSAENIRLETTSGNILCKDMTGKVDVTTTSGDITIQAAAGFGTYRAENSGKITVDYKNVTGNLSFYNKNDNIKLTLPKNLEFDFHAVTKNGSIRTDLPKALPLNQNEVKGRIGEHPVVNVKVETKNGRIEVEQ